MIRLIDELLLNLVNDNVTGLVMIDYRLATSRPLSERGEPFLAAKRPTANDEVASKAR